MSKNNERTNACCLLGDRKLSYVEHSCPPEEVVSTGEVAIYLGQNLTQTFRILVVIGRSRQYYVFMILDPASLSLKSVAKAIGGKSIAMLSRRGLLPLMGYIHNGCLPISMKKFFPTVVDASAEIFNSIIISARKRGYQVEPNPAILSKPIRFSYTALTG